MRWPPKPPPPPLPHEIALRRDIGFEMPGGYGLGRPVEWEPRDRELTGLLHDLSADELAEMLRLACDSTKQAAGPSWKAAVRGRDARSRAAIEEVRARLAGDARAWAHAVKGWWARRLDAESLPLELRRGIQAQKLCLRGQYVVESDVPGWVEVLDRIGAQYGASEERLDRVFSAVTRVVLATANGTKRRLTADLARALAEIEADTDDLDLDITAEHELEGEVGDSAAGADADSPADDTSRAADAVGAEPVRDAPIATVSHGDAPLKAPAQPSPDAPTGAEAAPNLQDDQSTAVELMRRELSRAVALNAAIARAAMEGEYGRLPGLLERIQKLQTVVDESIDTLSHDGTELAVPHPSCSAIRDDETVRTFVAALSSALRARAQAAAEQTEQARRDYLARLAVLGLAPPDELGRAITRADVDAVRARDAERIGTAELDAMLRRRERPSASVLATVPPARRLAAYLARAEADEAVPSETIADWLRSDAEACALDRAAAARAILASLERSLRGGGEVPPRAWALLADCSVDALVGWLARADVEDLVRDTSSGALRIEELAAIAPDDPRIVVPIRNQLDAWRLRGLPPPARTSRLAAVAAASPGDSFVAAELLASLAEEERWADLTLVRHAYRAAGVEIAAPVDARAAFLATLADRCVEGGSQLGRLEELARDTDWAGEDPDAWTVLLFLAARLARGPESLYRYQSRLRAVGEIRPALVRLWLDPALAVRPSPLADEGLTRAWSDGRAALAEWDHEIQKPTCYRSWRYAEDYQRLIRAWLEDQLLRAEAGEPADGVDAEDLLHVFEVQSSLPRVDYPARHLMLGYVDAQRRRLKAIASALRRGACDDADVLRRHELPPLYSELRREAAEPENRAPAVKAVYRFVEAACATTPK